MKKVVALSLILCLVIFIGCATLALSPKERSLLRDFDEVSFTADDIKAMEARGLDPKCLTPRQKIEIVKDWKDLQAALMFYQ